MSIELITTTIKNKAKDFGFLEANIANIIIDQNTRNEFNSYLAQNFHGDMQYLNNNKELRFNPSLLHKNTLSIISVKMAYLIDDVNYHNIRLNNHDNAYISNYALGRDYHKVVKQQLTKYASWINQFIASCNIEPQFDFNYRVFTDSAPILEAQLAKNAGNGWIGKNTLLINKHQGSFFVLGELFSNLLLIADTATTAHCGSCSKCLTICPTQAFIAPYVLDARKCISYLTIESRGSIPVEYRKAIGNRIYGCDDCQLVCPWNKFSHTAHLKDFHVRHNLDKLTLIEAFLWTEQEWQAKMQGSSIYRIGYISWLRNVAVALGNADTTPDVIEALTSRINDPSPIVREHTLWALHEHQNS